MAVVPRIASLRIQVAVETGRHRTWTATATTQDTPAGGSVSVSVTRVIGFAGSPDPATTLELRFYNDSGTLIRTVALDDAAAFPQSTTYHFTDTGASGGASRAGTIEIAIYARREPVAGTIIYEVETDATPNNPGTGNQSVLDRGWIRTLLDATVALSNVALGGAKNTPASYPDSLFARVTLSAVLYVARAFTVAMSNTTPALSAATNSATSGNFDVTFASVVDDRFPVTTTTTSVTVPNSTLTGLPFVVLTTTNDSISVDSRRNANPHLWQADDDVMGTPPMSKHEASKSALVSSYSAMAMRLVNARNEGLNGLSGNMIMDPRGAGATKTTAVTTATRGGEAGWTDLVQLGPFVIGGAWDVTLDLTAPSGASADTHLLNGTDVVTILAPDPRIQLRGYVNKQQNHKGHFTEGEPVVVNLTVMSFVDNIRIVPTRVTEPKMSIVRYRSSDDRLEYLESDGTTWTLWEPASPAAMMTMTPSPNDPRNYIKLFPDTFGWGRDIMAVLFSVKVDGTPYSGFISREETGADNDHSGFGFDGIAFATGSGVVSFQ